MTAPTDKTAASLGTLSPLHIKPEDHTLTHEGMGNYVCSCGIPTPGWPCPVLANSGVEWGPDPRMSYVTVQIDSNTWDVLSRWRADE
jgi:hypothetical protein